MSDASKLITTLKRNLLPVGLFLLLFPALFLGDGLQPLVDVYVSAALLLWSIIVIKNHLPEKRLPLQFLIPWLLVLTFTLLSIPGSVSPGLSISAFVRVLLAFVVFFVVYIHSPLEHFPIFLKSLLVFVTVAAAISFLLPIFPQLAPRLPTSNLLYAFFGHNHLGALLLLVFPLVLDRFRMQKNPRTAALLVFYLLSIFLTFGRGVVLFLFLYLLYSALKKRASRLLVVLPLLFLIGLHFLSLRPSPFPSPDSWASRQIYKPASILDSRVKYFAESITAFKTRPVLGTGPGTFILSSQKYAKAPNSSSVYVHSFPLEILSDTGLAGLLVWGSLLSVLFYSAFKKTSPLLEGVVLLFLYSCVDFSLNFVVVWLIFWSALAILTAQHNKNSPDSKLPSVLFHFSQILIGLFFLSASLSQLPGLSWLAPYYRSSAAASFQNPLTFSLHKQDPEVLFSYYQLHSSSLLLRDRLSDLLKIVKLAPYNWTYHAQILDTVVKIGDPKLIADEITYLASLLYPNDQALIKEINFYRPEISSHYTPQMVYLAHPENNANSLYLFYYVLGKKLLATDPTLTRKLWLLASKIHPWSGLMYAERSALELYTFKDRMGAQEIISQCKTVPPASGHCQTLLPDLSNLNRPGDLDFLIFKYE